MVVEVWIWETSPLEKNNLLQIWYESRFVATKHGDQKKCLSNLEGYHPNSEQKTPCFLKIHWEYQHFNRRWQVNSFLDRWMGGWESLKICFQGFSVLYYKKKKLWQKFFREKRNYLDGIFSLEEVYSSGNLRSYRKSWICLMVLISFSKRALII